MRVRHGHGESYARAFTMLVSRHRQRYGGYLVHLGLVLLAVGVIGSQMFQVERDAQLRAGQSATVSGYTVTYRGVSDTTRSGIETIQAHLTVSQGSGKLGDIFPGQRIFPGFESQPTSIVSITTYHLKDVYVFLAGVDSGSVTIRVFINPLVTLIWLGGLAMLFGGVVCWWPERRKLAELREKRQLAATRAARQEATV